MTATYPATKPAPQSATVYVYDWGHDYYGNPTARYTIFWPTPTGQGVYTSRRREPVGYVTEPSLGAFLRLKRLFPGTLWAISEPGVKGGRADGVAIFEAMRADVVPVDVSKLK